VDWTRGQGSFVLVSSYEVLQQLKDTKFKELKAGLKKVRKQLVEDKDNKGAQLLVKLIN
jgi:pumilio family protein 6